MAEIKDLIPYLDPGIKDAVIILAKAGVETCESCEGGPGHAFPEPTICFHGQRDEGFRALAVAMQHGLPVSTLQRAWLIIDGEPTGPFWELVFYEKPVCDLTESGIDDGQK